MGIDNTVISPEFRLRLDQLPNGSTIDVIIHGIAAETQTNNAERYRASLISLHAYLERRGIHVENTLRLFGVVFAHMNRTQIYNLSQQPYVRSIFENRETHIKTV